MQKFSVLVMALLCLNIAFAQNTTSQIAVYFDKDKSKLTSKAQSTLIQTLQSIPTLEEYTVKIEAHTDSDGSLEYNQLLSEKRANAVYTFLLQQGMNTQDLQIVAQGETDPSFSNQTETGQQQNRRVDVFFITKASLQQTTRTNPKIKTFKDLRRLISSNVEQSFTISTNQKQTIEAQQGTKITIPSNAFIFEDGSPLPSNVEVEVQVQEALSLEDMVLNNLSTMSGDQMLETGGMIAVEANYQGNTLKLKEDKPIEVMVPKGNIATSKQEEMELFYGVASGDKNDAMDWQPTNESVETTAPHPVVPIDLTPLQNFVILEKPTGDLNQLIPVSAKIPAPQKPAKPIPPKKPNIYQYKFTPPPAEKYQYTKQQIRTISERQYQEAIETYKKELIVYQDKIENYQDEMFLYKSKMTTYRKQSIERQRVIKQNMKKLMFLSDLEKNGIKTWEIARKWKEYMFQNDLTSKPPSKLFKELSPVEDSTVTFTPDYVANKLGISSLEALYLWSENRDSLYKVHLSYYSSESIDSIVRVLDRAYFDKKEEMGILTREDFDYYTTNINQLGWINIDRWLKNRQTEQLLVRGEQSQNTRYFVISHTFNSCMRVSNLTRDENHFTVELPLDESFTLVGLKIEGDKFWMESQDFRVQPTNQELKVIFKEKSPKDLSQTIHQIEGKRNS